MDDWVVVQSVYITDKNMDLRGWSALIIQRAWERFLRRAFYKSVCEKSNFFPHGLSGKRLLFLRAAERCPKTIERAVGSVPFQTVESWKFHALCNHKMTTWLHDTEGYFCDICEIGFKCGDLAYSCSNWRCDWDICEKCRLRWGNYPPCGPVGP